MNRNKLVVVLELVRLGLASTDMTVHIEEAE